MDIQSIHVNSVHTRPIRIAAPEVYRRGQGEESGGPGRTGRVLRERGDEALARLDARAANALENAGNENQRRILNDRISTAREGLEARIANALAPYADDPDSSGGVADASDAGGAAAEGVAREATSQGDRFERLRVRLATVEAEGNRSPFGDRPTGGDVGGVGDGDGDGDGTTNAQPAAAVGDTTRVDDVEPGDRREVGRTGAALREAASAQRNAIMQRLANALEGAENGNQRRILSERAGERLGEIQERLSNAMARMRGEGTDPVAGNDGEGGNDRVSDRMLLERIQEARGGLFDRVRDGLAAAETDDQRRFLTDAFTAAYKDLENRIAGALRDAGLFDEVADQTRVAGGESAPGTEQPGADDGQAV